MSNNSGIPQTLINTRTRALSTEAQALQYPAAKALAHVLKRVHSDVYISGTDLSAAFPANVNSTPLTADVFGGLKVRPFSTYLLVEPGVLGANVITANYDAATDSSYVIVDDPGVTSAATLTFVANSSGSLRVDVVECTVMEVETQASREVYDPLSRQFDPPQLMVTGRTLALAYRIRQGTAGAGYPGNVIGWLPLAVAIHHANSTSFSNVDFYDVRPLLRGRRDTGCTELRVPSLASLSDSFHYVTDTSSIIGSFDLTANIREVSGPVPGTYMGPWRAQGVLNRTLPAVSETAETLNLIPDAAAYYSSSTTAGLANRWMYVLSFEPFGLPRWAKYTTAAAWQTGEREPTGNWGLYALASTVAVSPSFRIVSTTLPAGYGLGASVMQAQVVAVYKQTASYAALPTVSRRGGLVASTYPPAMQTVTGTSDSGASPNVTDFALALDSDVGLPANINGFRARIECDVAPSAQVESCYVTVVLRGGGLDVSPVYRQSFGQLANSFTCKLALNVDFTVSPLLSNGPFTVHTIVTMSGATTVSFSLFNAVLTLEGFYIGT